MQMQMYFRCRCFAEVANQIDMRLGSQTACAPEALGWIYVLRPLPPDSAGSEVVLTEEYRKTGRDT